MHARSRVRAALQRRSRVSHVRLHDRAAGSRTTSARGIGPAGSPSFIGKHHRIALNTNKITIMGPCDRYAPASENASTRGVRIASRTPCHPDSVRWPPASLTLAVASGVMKRSRSRALQCACHAASTLLAKRSRQRAHACIPYQYIACERPPPRLRWRASRSLPAGLTINVSVVWTGVARRVGPP